jgi:hypothetical protein
MGHQGKSKGTKMKNVFHKPFIAAYRSASFVALSSILLIAVCYLFLLVFYTASTTWAAPITLSPSQERVLAFQPQVANLEATLLKQRVDLTTFEMKYVAEEEQLTQINRLLARFDDASRSEARELAKTGTAVDAVITDKKLDIAATTSSTAEARALLKQIDVELAAKLITIDQAATRRIALQSALNASTDARAAMTQLTETSRQLKAGSSTLSGGSASLSALAALQQTQQLRTLATTLEINIQTSKLSAAALKTTITDSERVLAVAKTSPYHAALRAPVSVLFVPYDNLKNAKLGEPVYDCYLQIIACRKVGVIETLYEAEEYARHPLFKTDLKGRFVGVKFDVPEAAKSQVVFVGGKPLFL